MTRLSKITAMSLAGALIATLAVAQNDPITAAIKARQVHMGLSAFNISQLGAMAQGAMPYDAAAAQAAADNLVTLGEINQMAYWPVGSDNASVAGTRAKPEIWTMMDDMLADANALHEAALAMQAAASGGLEGLQAAMGPLGAACGSCHEEFRAPE